MPYYDIEVEETVHRTMRYRVYADDWREAETKAESGETEDETILKEHGVINRTIVPKTRKRTPLFVRVEWDLNYHGGDYAGVGDFVLLPEDGLTDDNIGKRFQAKTGYGPEHIIHYSFDELYDEDGELLDG